jgi:hypothetical protein
LVRVANFEYPPFSIKTARSNNKGEDDFIGLEVSLVRTIIQSLGMSGLKFVKVTQKWMGMFLAVEHDLADLGLGQVFMDPGEVSDYYMDQYYDIDGICYLLKRPKRNDSFNAWLMPFETVVWIFILVTIILSSFLTSLLLHVSPDDKISPKFGYFFILSQLFGQSTRSTHMR